MNDPINDTPWSIQTMSGPKLAALASELYRLANLTTLVPEADSASGKNYQPGANVGLAVGQHAKPVAAQYSTGLLEFSSGSERATSRSIGAFRILVLIRNVGRRIPVVHLVSLHEKHGHVDMNRFDQRALELSELQEGAESRQELMDEEAVRCAKEGIASAESTLEEKEILRDMLKNDLDRRSKSRAWKTLRAIQGKALEALRTMPIGSAMDAVRALDKAITTERLIRGEPTDRTAVNVEDLIRREYERWMGDENQDQ